MRKNFVLQNINGIWFGISPLLDQKGIKHAFTTKLHGQSKIMPESLNMSFNVNDDIAFILKNRRAVCNALAIDFDKLTNTKQVHKDYVIYVDEKSAGFGNDSFEQAIDDTDAVFTDKKGIPLMLLFADCTPVIIGDPVSKAVAVVHAGWRGTVQNIVQKTLYTMQKQLGVNPADCYAAAGPSMGPCCYQVGEEVYSEARKNLTGYEEFFVEQGNKQWLFDMWQANKRQLLKAGLLPANIVLSKVCTHCNKELFFSHRADKGKTGRFAAIAWI